MAIAFHFNGKTLNKYSEKEKSFLGKLLDDNRKKVFLEQSEIFTYDDQNTNPFLTECCNKLGLEVTNLATPEALHFLNSEFPVNPAHPSEKFCLLFKLLSLYYHIKNNSYSKKYYFLLDQSDVFLAGNPESAIDVLEEKGCHILYNAESRCMYWPMLFRNDKRYSSLNKYFMNYTDVKNFEEKIYGQDCYESDGYKTCFLNGGMTLGETEYFVDFMEKYLPFFREFINVNEQTMLHHFHFCYYPDIQIDHKCEAFQCMGPNKIGFNHEYSRHISL